MFQRLFLAILATLSLYLFLQSNQVSDNSILLQDKLSNISKSLVSFLLPQK